MSKTQQDLVFNWAVHTFSRLQCSYVFPTDVDVGVWSKETLPKLKEKYGAELKYRAERLDGLKVGDCCFVRGEGNDLFEIKSLIQYEKDRYGFVLNTGICEEVSKCFSHWGPDATIKFADDHTNRIIICHRCNRESWHTKDIEDLWCNTCDRTHVDVDYETGE